MKVTKAKFLTAFFLFLTLLSPTALRGQETKSTSKVIRDDRPIDTQKIIRALTAKETEFRRALADYAFQRDALVQTIGMGGQVTGEYHRTSQFVFDNNNE